jgi:hypothetical protein
MSAKKRPVRHHYIPATYLRRFSDEAERRIEMYRRSSGTLCNVSIKDAAVATDFYTITDASGAKLSDVEDMLAKVESETDHVLRAIDRGEFPPTDEGRSWLATFIALLMTRTPEFRHVGEEVADYEIKMHEHSRMQREQHYGSAGRRSSEAVEAAFERLEAIRLLPTQNAAIASAMSLALYRLFPVILRMDWHLFMTETPAFVTSDCPVVLVRDEASSVPGAGIETAKEVYIPLGARRLLVMKHTSREGEPVHQADEAFVEHVNAAVIAMAYEAIFHHPDHRPLGDLVLPEERAVITANNVPIYQGGKGAKEARERTFSNPMHSGDRISYFSLVSHGDPSDKGHEPGWHGNSGLIKKHHELDKLFNDSPLRQPGDTITMVIPISSDRILYVVWRGPKYWTFAYDGHAGTWKDLGEQDRASIDKLRG